jgi:hypothetical protein
MDQIQIKNDYPFLLCAFAPLRGIYPKTAPRKAAKNAK